MMAQPKPTLQEVKHPKREPETIIDKTPKEPFLSPLMKFIKLNCDQCPKYGGLCRENDSRGLTPMSLCIMLYMHENPTVIIDDDVQEAEPIG